MDQKLLNQAIFLLKQGYSLETLEDETGLPRQELLNIAKAHALRLEEARFYSDISKQIQARLPEIIHSALSELHRIIKSPRSKPRDKLSAIKTVVDLSKKH